MVLTLTKSRTLSSKPTTLSDTCKIKLIRYQKMKLRFRIPPSILIKEKLNTVSTKKMQRIEKTKIQLLKLRCLAAMVTVANLKRTELFSPIQISLSDTYYP
jgi:hypothetical protein